MNISFDLLDIARARAQAGPQQSLSDAIVNTGGHRRRSAASVPLKALTLAVHRSQRVHAPLSAHARPAGSAQRSAHGAFPRATPDTVHSPHAKTGQSPRVLRSSAYYRTVSLAAPVSPHASSSTSLHWCCTHDRPASQSTSDLPCITRSPMISQICHAACMSCRSPGLSAQTLSPPRSLAWGASLGC